MWWVVWITHKMRTSDGQNWTPTPALQWVAALQGMQTGHPVSEGKLPQVNHHFDKKTTCKERETERESVQERGREKERERERERETEREAPWSPLYLLGPRGAPEGPGREGDSCALAFRTMNNGGYIPRCCRLGDCCHIHYGAAAAGKVTWFSSHRQRNRQTQRERGERHRERPIRRRGRET